MVEITAISATDALITEAFALRHEMFVIEQGVPQELEVDDDDKIATHLVAFSQGRVVGTLRIVLHGCTAKIGRMAVSTSLRKNSIGCGLMEFAALTTSRGGQIILTRRSLHATSTHDLATRKKALYSTMPEIPHVVMRKNLGEPPE